MSGNILHRTPYPTGECPRRGPAPTLKIEQQKRSSEQILSSFTYILLLISYSQLFSELGPPEKLKNKKKKDFRPPLTNSWTRHCPMLRYCFISSNTKCKPICMCSNSNVTAFHPPHTVFLRNNIVCKANVVITKAKCLYIPIIHIYLLFFAHVCNTVSFRILSWC